MKELNIGDIAAKVRKNKNLNKEEVKFLFDKYERESRDSRAANTMLDKANGEKIYADQQYSTIKDLFIDLIYNDYRYK